MHTRIIWYVERELEKKGLRKTADGQGDLFVRYYAKAHEGLKGTPSQGESYLPGGAGQLTTGVDFSKAVEGTLILELQRVLGREGGVARRDPATSRSTRSASTPTPRAPCACSSRSIPPPKP